MWFCPLISCLLLFALLHPVSFQNKVQLAFQCSLYRAQISLVAFTCCRRLFFLLFLFFIRDAHHCLLKSRALALNAEVLLFICSCSVPNHWQQNCFGKLGPLPLRSLYYSFHCPAFFSEHIYRDKLCTFLIQRTLKSHSTKIMYFKT